MGSTFLKLTNNVLKKINEVQLSSSNFDDVLGIHAAAKDAVNFAINKINTQKFEWPFNSTDGSQLLTVGQEEYNWPANYKIADWNSFYIEKDDTLNVNTRHLRGISRDVWLNRYRDLDFDSETDGRSIPNFVFKGSGNTFGITPSPDKAYTVKYKYFVIPTELSVHDDTTTIPSYLDYIILSGAMWYIYLWRDNEERAAMAEGEFRGNMKVMTRLLIGDPNTMQDTMINYGGGVGHTTPWILYD